MKKAQKSPKTPPKYPQSTKPTNSFFARNKIALIVVTLIILFVVTTIYIPNILLYNEWKPKMQTYLNNKYGTEFVIENVYHQPAEVGSPGTIYGQAHHPDHPDLAIILTGDKWDNFQQVYWQKQEQQRLTQVVHDIFGNDTKVRVQLSFKTPTIEQSINYTYPLPDFETVRGELGDKVNLDLTIEKKSNPTQKPPLQPLAEKTWKLVQQEVHPYEGQVSFSILDRYISLGKKYRCSTYEGFNAPTVLSSVEQVKGCYVYKDNNR